MIDQAKITIRPARSCTQDSEILAMLHHETLSDYLLAALGTPYLQKTHYPKLLNHDKTFCLIAYYKEEAVGFICITYDASDLMKTVQDNKLALILPALSAVFANPLFIHDFISLSIGTEMRWYKKATTQAELLTVGVLPDYQSFGIGKLLVEKGMQIVMQESAAHRVLVKTDTLRAAKFYERFGFERVGFEDRGSVTNFLMVLDLQCMDLL